MALSVFSFFLFFYFSVTLRCINCFILFDFLRCCNFHFISVWSPFFFFLQHKICFRSRSLPLYRTYPFCLQFTKTGLFTLDANKCSTSDWLGVWNKTQSHTVSVCVCFILSSLCLFIRFIQCSLYMQKIKKKTRTKSKRLEF